MAKAYGMTLFVLSLTVLTVVCQTFQYSRGWRNGKRSESAPADGFVNFANRNGGQFANAFASCELQKLRQLLQGNLDEELLQLPCEMFNAKKSFTENIVPPHFR